MIRHTEVDGVPTVIAPARGPMRAGLVFRVGMADETLVTSGITHLVEHLALSGFELPGHHANGETRMINTHFYAQGSPTDVSTFLTRTCDALTSLPIDRLETEKTIVRTEAASRGTGADWNMPVWRYGAQGYGLVGGSEFGVETLRPETVLQWAAEWFTRENAVLWIAGDDVPSGLRLRLRGGVRRPTPPVTSALPLTPAYYADGSGQVTMDAVVSRSVTAHVLATVLERRLFQGLRQERGGSYTATASYRARDAENGIITALADALPEKQDVVVHGFLEVLTALKAGHIAVADVDAGKARLTNLLSDPDFEAAILPSNAADLLTGRPISTVEQWRAETEAVTAAGVHATAVEAMASALLQLPDGYTADWAGFARAPMFSPSAVEGIRYASRESTEVSLVVGGGGVSLLTPDGPVTVRYDQCVAAEAWPHGARRLVGADGMIVSVDPSRFAIDPRATAMIDAGTPFSVMIWRPPIQVEAAAQAATGRPPARSWLRTTGRVLTWTVFVAWLLFALLATVGMAGKDDAGVSGWIGVAVVWFVGWPFRNALFRNVRKLRTAA
ncbi:hypothetical protein LFM09_23390 [Lentzea alba]|uniref:M16 family metallopeptidase n=1 Tax=Lentzea alba TaxID=2714351 RepID=UPI0039BF056B